MAGAPKEFEPTMSSTQHTLRLIGAFAALVILALAASCRGFFVNPTLTSIAISPTTPQVELTKTLQLQAFGTYDDGSRSQIKSGVSWSSDAPTIAPVDPNTGILTGAETGTANITADAQGLSSSASATVFIVITAISISPQNPSIPATSTISFKVDGTVNGNPIDISSGATVVVQQGGTAVTTITCGFQAGLDQVCTATAANPGTYNVVATYTGSTLQATTTLIIQ
jgi:Bacterial Ig-like domain (group 2)